ncbi:hypothetical protein PXH78_26955 [Mycolicibacterium smegmatis]|uniref:hypothetical protein n=1 Tax=Mycolicibacterium smegmatis TaxID=1772 RepID=UPI0005D843D5|nr:hypothetical protein [Mycolicibacterium smegmatis]MDF1902752.1 hypothetical protein [Mycolicibacterium smegmatis]MDF1909028.1 hypothetical protein [Mycolicibacterium smegmatis]MDF1921247.1 hypothetical protein [Mycolicibacterium smegmatis]MDF1927512.1 hypothetical protein [Mycolicibacterium smegmatis]UAK53369.1 hypothetical protein K8P01_22515 [Mycolicibacterium smegmatis]
MTAPGVFPYAPKVVRTYLVDRLGADVRVATKVPANRPAKLVTITMVPAGDSGNLALSPRRLIIHCYSASEDEAGELAEMVFSHLRAARYVTGSGLRDVSILGTPALFPDPDDSTPRFQMTVDVLLRAAV